MKKYIAFLIFINIPFFSFSQEYIDLFTINYGKTGDTSYKNHSENTTITTFETDFTLPVVLNKKYTVITGGDFSSNTLQLFPDSNYSHLYLTRLKAGINISHAERWSGNYILLPKLSSDYTNISSEDLYIGGVFMLKYKKSPNLSYKFGLYASTEAFGLFICPVIGLYYHSPNSRFEMKMSMPFDADLNYDLSSKTKIGFNYIARGSSFKLTENNIRTNYVQNNSLEFSTYLQQNFFNNSILLLLKMGYTTNSFEVYPIDQKIDFAVSAFKFGDNRTQLNPELASSLFFKIESVYRFDISKNKK